MSEEKPFKVVPPTGEWAPVILDSPHSGRRYPVDFAYAAPLPDLRTGEDTFVEELFTASEYGATLIAAQFPRTYIDPNRALADVDLGLIDGVWPDPVCASEKTSVGKGLIWRTCLGSVPIYARKLSVAEVARRIDNYWRPYRAALSQAVEQAHARAGAVWHINCHSMPSLWPPGVEGAGLPVEADFLLGNRDGATSDPAMVELVKSSLEGEGYSVAVNDRFKGVDIVKSVGNPARRRNSLQIEVVRSRYMLEDSFEKSQSFAAVQKALGATTGRLCEFARANTTV